MPTEVATIAPTSIDLQIADTVGFVGTTGFLHRTSTSSQYVWTRFADRNTSVRAGLTDPVANGALYRPAGGDSIYRASTGKITLTNLATQATRDLTLPTGRIALAVNGTTVLVRSTTSPQVIELLNYDDSGTPTTSPVTGIPDGTLGCTVVAAWQPDTSGAIVRCAGLGFSTYVFIDLTTGAAVALSTAAPLWAIGQDHIVGMTSTAPASFVVYSRQGLTDGTNTAATTIAAPTGLNTYLGVVGDHIIATNPAVAGSPVWDVPVDGTTPSTLYSKTSAMTSPLLAGPNGDVLVVGGMTSTDWGVHHLTANASGALVDTRIRLADAAANAGITMDHGIVRHAESSNRINNAPYYVSYVSSLGSYSDDPATGLTGPASLDSPIPCQTGVACARVMGGNYYGAIYLRSPNSVGLSVTGGSAYTSALATWAPNAQITDVSPYYAIVNSGTQQHLVSLAQNQILRTGPVIAGALSESAIWQPTRVPRSGVTPAGGATSRVSSGDAIRPDFVPGSITKYDVWSNAVQQAIQLPTTCTPSELQADTVWIYWSCGASGPAGAYNLNTSTNVALPAGKALLGDGFAVIQNGQTLKLYAFQTGSLADPVTIGTVPAGPVTDARQFTWTVDKAGGDIAYVDAGDTVHVIDSGVPNSLASVLLVRPNVESQNPWMFSLWLSRPVSSWTVTFKSATSGAIVKTVTGGATRRNAIVSWDLAPDGGTPLRSDTYTWTATLTTPDGTSAPYAGDGRQICGTMVFRTWDCSGEPAFLAVKSGAANGEGHWFTESADGSLIDGEYTDSWSSFDTTALVPWGDFNGDGNADMLVRDSTGVLRAYLGLNQAYFNYQVNSSIKVGTGWQVYNALLTSGDLNGDGVFDMIARDKSGGLYMYPGRAGGRFGTRVLIGTGWGSYKQLIGPGDITGDGKADLLAEDAAGTLWRYNGKGTGTWSARVQVSTGWNTYTAIVGIGDYNHDGHNDLIARDSSGTLWLFTGDGAGGFNPRTKLSSGFAAYPRIY